jgi:hypothetical protein
MTDGNDSIYSAAVEYHELGLSVIPISRSNKIPAIKWKQYQSRVATRKEIDEWFLEGPCYYNIGLVTGLISRVVVLDCDPRHGGDASLLSVGLKSEDATVITGSGGTHFYYGGCDLSLRCTTGLLAGLDFKGEGGYVLLPPSIHPTTGKEYKWLNRNKWMTGSPPEEVMARQEKPALQLKSHALSAGMIGLGVIPLPGPAAVGHRNAGAAQLAGRLFSRGIALDKVCNIMRLWNSDNIPPLSDRELDHVIESIYSYHKEKYV